MSWFRKKTTPSPPLQPSSVDLDSRIREQEREFTERTAKWIAGLKQKFDSVINEQASELQTRGLPVPQIQGELTYEFTSDRSIRLAFPSPLIPPHFVVNCRSNLPPPENWRYFTPVAYVVTGTQAEVEEARRTYEQQGIIALRRAHPGLWINQNPYDMYAKLEYTSRPMGRVGFTDAMSLNERDVSSALSSAFGGLVNPQTLKFYMPIQRLPDVTTDDLRQFERSLTLYSELSFNRPQYAFADLFSYTAPLHTQSLDFLQFPNKIFFTDLPEPTFSPDPTAFKVLPADTIRPNVAREFLESLRPITRPVAVLFCRAGPGFRL